MRLDFFDLFVIEFLASNLARKDIQEIEDLLTEDLFPVLIEVGSECVPDRPLELPVLPSLGTIKVPPGTIRGGQLLTSDVINECNLDRVPKLSTIVAWYRYRNSPTSSMTRAAVFSSILITSKSPL